MPQYEVAGWIINIESDSSLPLEYFNKFLITQKRASDFNIIIREEDFIKSPEGIVVSNDNKCKVIKKTSDTSAYAIYLTELGNNSQEGRIKVLADFDQDWRNVIIKYCPIYEAYNLLIYTMIGVAFRYFLIHFDGLIIHSSTLKWNDKGIMFSAPSETGKSTQVKLWQQYLDGVTVLNDDTPAVRIINDKFYVFGTPWCGSKLIHSNDSAPLAAIVLLEQAPNNVIRRLTDHQEIISRLLPRVFLPYFDQNMMRLAMGIFERIILSVPIYLLQCRPDKEAMELVHQCVK